MARYPERPVVGVGVVVLRRNGAGEMEVLMIRRGKAPRLGQWSIPGGRQLLGESLAAAARREVLEETGVEIDDLRLIDTVDSITHDQAGNVEYHYSLIYFAARWQAGEARAGSDAMETRWVEQEGLVELAIWEETRRVIGLALEVVS